MKLAFLGAGNMAGAIIKSALRGGVLNGNEILCVNARNPEHGRHAKGGSLCCFQKNRLP